jgi:hypothetical protein
MANFADKSGVLGQLWLEFREDEDFKEFVEYNDIGLPLGYFVAEGLIKETTDLGETYVLETFDMLISLLKISEEEVDRLDEIDLGNILEMAYNKKKNAEEDPDLK